MNNCKDGLERVEAMKYPVENNIKDCNLSARMVYVLSAIGGSIAIIYNN